MRRLLCLLSVLGYARPMAIDRTGKWWKGISVADLDEQLIAYRPGGYSPDRFAHPVCCGVSEFRIEVDDEEGVVRRTCDRCRAAHLMLDSEEFIEDASPEECACPCGAEVFELSVGFSHREDGSVKWVAVGGRCVSCGVLGTYADWKIDYEPTDHLYDRA